MSRKLTVSIGIPAYNEEQNVGNLLVGILKQIPKSYILEQIIVVSDGSTDRTDKVVQLFGDRRIKFIRKRKRVGINRVQNLVAKTNQSDVLVLVDADVLLKNDLFIEYLVQAIRKHKAALVAANSECLRGLNFIERVLSFSHRFKQTVYENISRDNVYLCRGVARAFAKKLYKHLVWPDSCPEDSFSYFFAKVNNYKFYYEKDAFVTFRSPRSVREQSIQSNRFFHGIKRMQEMFPTLDIKSEYAIPKPVLLKYLIKYLFLGPILLPTYIFISFYIRNFCYSKPAHHSRYKIVTSSKDLTYNV